MSVRKVKTLENRGARSPWIIAVCLVSLLGFPGWSKAEGVVVASTSLAGAIARAAGAKEVRVLTPSDITHPPEYELRPSDLQKFQGADFVVYAGYEKMVAKLLESAKTGSLAAIQIDTTASPENLITQVEKVAKALGTEKEVDAWRRQFLTRLNSYRAKISPLSGKRAVVHLHAQPFSRWAGLSVVAVIRPGELTPRAIADSIAQGPELVVDILHLPTAKVIAENGRCRYIQVINFPGVENTKELEDIFDFNSRQLIRAFE